MCMGCNNFECRAVQSAASASTAGRLFAAALLFAIVAFVLWILWPYRLWCVARSRARAQLRALPLPITERACDSTRSTLRSDHAFVHRRTNVFHMVMSLLNAGGAIAFLGIAQDHALDAERCALC